MQMALHLKPLAMCFRHLGTLAVRRGGCRSTILLKKAKYNKKENIHRCPNSEKTQEGAAYALKLKPACRTGRAGNQQNTNPGSPLGIAEENVVFPVAGFAKLLAHVVDVLGCGTDEHNALQMGHSLPGLVVQQVQQKHLLAEDAARPLDHCWLAQEKQKCIERCTKI